MEVAARRTRDGPPLDDDMPEQGPDGGNAAARLAHRRAAPRDSLFLQATLRRAGDAQPATMRIRNLSSGGMMAEISEPFEEGDRIEIELRGIGALDGTVIWRTDTRIGIAFAEPIDPRRARKSVALRMPAAPPAVAPRTTRRPKLFGE